MKELSIEEKAKRFDEALERAKNFIENGDERERTIAESIFAGLMEESEGEEIRKALIKYYSFDGGSHALDNITPKQIIAWLEKQGEKTFDKIVEKARTEKQRVLLTETDGSANIDWDCRSLDDVKILLKCGLEFIRTIEANKQILTNNRFGGCPFRVPTRYDKGVKQGEQKPTWSEEDSDMVDDIVKSLKKYQLQMPNYRVELQMRWLKSLKERYTWKPSDEQMKCISDVVADAKYKNDISTNGYEPYTHLSTLLQQLKKLREG